MEFSLGVSLMRLATVDFCSYNESVAAAFDAIDAWNTLAKQSAILIKTQPDQFFTTSGDYSGCML